LVIHLTGITKGSAYVISGRLTGFSPKWDSKIYLAAIRSINDFQSASDDLKINEAVIDKQGNFVLQGNNLPSDVLFYRVYLSNDGEKSMQLITGEEQNFIHLLLNNNSVLVINADLNTRPFYYAEIKASAYSSLFADFYKNIYYLNRQNFYSPYTKTHLNDEKAFQLI